MAAEHNAILCMTGSELTRGETRDSNGPFLARILSTVGVRVEEISLVPDDPDLLVRAVEAAIPRADVLIVGGGLGPTADDFTVQILARVFGRRVFRHPEAERRMRARARSRGLEAEDLPPNYFKQSEVLEGAEVILNPVGLAPGMIIPTARGLLAALPGVPAELEALFRELVLPAIERRFRLERPRIVRAKIMGMGESWAEARIQRLGIDFSRIEYGISAKPGELTVRFLSHRRDDHPYLDEVLRLLAGEFGTDIVFLPEGIVDPAGSLVEAEHSLLVHNMLVASGATLATAESCTGGLIAKSLTDHSGSSRYFLGSAVAYRDDAKVKVLGVPPDVLRDHGAVSEEVCGAMAQGARAVFGADFAVSTTGIAGPTGGTPEKPVGLVYIGLARKGGDGRESVQVDRALFWGNRGNVRTLSAVRALDLLRRALVPSVLLLLASCGNYDFSRARIGDGYSLDVLKEGLRDASAPLEQRSWIPLVASRRVFFDSEPSIALSAFSGGVFPSRPTARSDWTNYPPGHVLQESLAWGPIFACVHSRRSWFDVSGKRFERVEYQSFLWRLWAQSRSLVRTPFGTREEVRRELFWGLLPVGTASTYYAIDVDWLCGTTVP